jgi:nucleoside phosphorylase
MIDRKWMKRNLGFDPIESPAPANTFSFAPASSRPGKAKAAPEDFQREIIDFDSEAPEGKEFFSFSTATGLSRFTEIPWPARLAPKTARTAGKRAGGRLPKADVLVVAWTVDEGHATSRVLTPGKDSRNDYEPYKRNYAKLAKLMRKGAPALEAGHLGTFWRCTIGGKSVVVFKSDSHLSQDGPQTPNVEIWQQIIDDVQPKLVLTTGTGGGIGSQFEVGDVIVSSTVHFDCIRKFKKKFGSEPPFTSAAPKPKYFSKAKTLFKANAGQLPKDNARAPRIVVVPQKKVSASVVTTDFFGFDTSSNFYKLQGQGDLSEMGDAVLGYVCNQLGAAAPRFLAVRNVSDPQIKSAGLTIKQQANMAAQIYKGFGRWSTVCSAIVCWALIAAE